MVRIVVVGCSYGGLRCLLRLRKLLPDAELVGIDPSPYHVNITGFPRFFAGEVSHLALLLPLQEFLSKHKIEYLQEEVTGLSPHSKHIYTSKRRTEYDYLVLALGATHKLIPNASLGLYSPYTLQEVKDLRGYIEKHTYQGKPVHAVIVGAGLAGIEWACALSAHLKDKGTVTILDRNTSILQGYRESLRNYVLKNIAGKKIELKLGVNVETIQHPAITLDKGKIPYTVALLFAGVQNHLIVDKLNLDHNEKGILVTSTLQTTQYPEIFGVGDVIALANSLTQPIKRATAALIQGKIAADNLAHSIAGEPLNKYEVNEMPIGIYLGPHQGLIHYKGFQYGGWLAWWSKNFRESHYL